MTQSLLSVLSGSLIAGEGLAPLIGTHLLSLEDNLWISTKNYFFLGLDTLTGGLLIILPVTEIGIAPGIVTCFIVLIALGAHAYRVWEYLTKKKNPFCTNRRLHIFNRFKILILVALIATCFLQQLPGRVLPKLPSRGILNPNRSLL